MKDGDETLWTIDELGKSVAAALDGPGYEGVPSGPVRDVPDLRTIRYYTTLGLLDRPASMRGRTALYGPRHLLQLVATKRLQARGLSLAAVQERVVGLSDAALKRIIAAEARASPPWQERPPQASASRAESFWRLAAEEYEDRAHAADPVVQNVALGSGLELSLPVERELNQDDLRVIRMAAAPLIELLKLRGLIGVGPSQRNQGDAP